MPQLPEYNTGGATPPSELRPNEAGVAAEAQAGYRIGRFFNEEGADIGGSVRQAGADFQKHVTSTEIMRAAPLLSETQAQLDDAWNTVTSQPGFDPTDPTVRQRFMQEHVGPALAKLQQGMTTPDGQQWMVGQTYQTVEHFNTKTIGDISKLVADHTITSLDTTANTQAQRVYGDPSALDSALGTLDSTVEAMKQAHGMDAVGQEQVDVWHREQQIGLVYQAYRGAIAQAPDPAERRRIR